ncbi:MAG: bifunctional hydroxymethylpyrimidine kinase/phosphomethylpyrimidine kinase [Nitrospira sp.]|nr:bifunctional hydroxymethylpyrimidine kinase/phosphomethylpyrimidine kinase [Nitrospira sp.]
MEIQKTALTIAGSDPTGGAGFQADLRAFNKMGVYGLSVPTVLTAQNTEGVYSIHEVPANFISEQLDVLLRDIKPDAFKTGMLYNAEAVQAVALKIKEYSLVNLVIDPVTVSSTGVQLLEDKGLDAMKSELFPFSRVITPNIYEASVLTGIDISNEKEMKESAVRLKEQGCEAVIITGGHLGKKAVDMLFDGEEFLSLENERLEGEFHGTGCLFSSVITACLALGYNLKEAFIMAKETVWNAMKTAVPAGKGMKLLNI